MLFQKSMGKLGQAPPQQGRTLRKMLMRQMLRGRLPDIIQERIKLRVLYSLLRKGLLLWPEKTGNPAAPAIR